MRFEWDPKKAAENLRDHKVSFDEAVEAFFDPNRQEEYDEVHSTIEEPRYNLLGMSSRRLLFIAFTERGEYTRPISARRATAKEIKRYGRKKS